MNKTFAFCFVLFGNILIAQNKRIDNLVFEGAGIRGLAYAGAIKAMEEKNVLQGIKRIGGTSAGAITALLLSIGYTSGEIATIIGQTNYKKFNDGGIPVFGGMRRLQKKFGWYKGKKFERWLSEIIAKKTGDPDMDFQTIANKFIPLYITGTSLNDQKAFLFSAENFPTMKVKDAVRISMSIPLYYQAVYMDDEGNTFHNAKKGENYHLMVDGGFMNNFPIEIFDSTKYFDPDKPNSAQANPFTIGCRIDNAQQITLDKDPNNKTLAPVPIKSFGNYMRAFMILNMERLSRQKLTPADWARTISIADGSIGPKVRKMKNEKIALLVQNGYKATSQFLQ
jgi:NTE family protein